MGFSSLCYDVIKRIVQKEKKVKYQLYCDFHEFVPYELHKTAEYLLLPYMIVWDPLNDCQTIKCPHCTESGHDTCLSATKEWETGNKSSLIPRTLMDIGWYVALVGRTYTCKNKHRIISYHAGILNQIPVSQQPPFMLSHKIGITTAVYDLIIRMVESGTLFATIERVLRESHYDKFLRQKHQADTENFPDIREVYKPLSNDTILKVFLVNYDRNYGRYKREFIEVICKSLSIDHTFKAAANIGFMKDGRWVKLYDSLFIVLNEIGKVKDFKFTLGTAFDKVHSLMSNISTTYAGIEYIFTDNCCQIRNKLLELYPNSIIKLDLFHAIARLTLHMPNRHPLFYEAAREIGLVVRNVTDFAEKRRDATASPGSICQNMEKFLIKWRAVNVNGWKLINDKVECAFKNLLKHVNYGCLSDIPCGMGTNRNENLHKQLKQFVRNKLSVQTAQSIFTHIFYVRNCRADKLDMVPPIWERQPDPGTERLSTNDHYVGSNFATTDLRDEFYSSIMDCRIGTDHDYSKDYTDAFQVISLAKCLNSINGSIPASLTHRLYRYQGFTTMAASNWDINSYTQEIIAGNQMEEDTLLAILKEMNLEVVENVVDIYDSALLLIKHVCARPTTLAPFRSYFENLEKRDLKLTIIREIQESHNYSDYTNEELLSDEIDQRLVLVALSNLLGLTIVVIPSVIGIPMLPLLPEFSIIEEPQFMIFNCINNSFMPVCKIIKKIENHCKCGSHFKNVQDKKACVRNMRCSCLRKGERCSKSCGCKNCGNNKIVSSRTRERRKRIPQYISTSLSSQTSLQYSINQGEEIRPYITTLQHFVLEALLYTLMKNLKSSFEELDIEFIKDKLNEKYQKLLVYIKFSSEPEMTIHDEALNIEISSLEKWLKYRLKRMNNMKVLLNSSDKNLTTPDIL